MNSFPCALVLRGLAGAALALLGSSCVTRQMSSTAMPPLVRHPTSMPGAVGQLMMAKAELEFPAEAFRMRSYVGQDVNYPQVEHMHSPCYPAIYHPIATEKDVWVALVVDRDGRVRHAKCLAASDSLLVRRIERVARSWTYYPGTVNGAPEEFVLCVAVKYRWMGPGV